MYLAQCLFGLDSIAFLEFPLDLALRVELHETFLEPQRTAQHHVLACDDGSVRLGVFGDQLCGEVARSDVLGKRIEDIGTDRVSGIEQSLS